jgi:hypothetical protein
MRKRFLVLLTVALALASLQSIATAAVKPGTKCTKLGQTSTSAGIKYTCIKSGKNLVWDKGVSVKAAAKPELNPVFKPAEPATTPTPTLPATPTPTPSATPINFESWNTNIDSKMLSDQALRNFMAWIQTRPDSATNHFQLIQDNKFTNRISILKKSDDLSAKLFSSFVPDGTKTIIGATESWTIEQLAKTGWNTSSCNNPYMTGVALCLDAYVRQGFVITADSTYDPRNPGSDGGALLAHEYFHLIQTNLQKSKGGMPLKSGDSNSQNALPAWFVEGTADFVGYAVGALAQNASYWDGRTRMLSYSPPGPSTNRNSIADYEIRTCCGNDTPTYPYNIGQVASEYIIASVGFQKMLDIFVDFGTSQNFEKSFEKVTGISKTAFYEKFDQIRTNVGLPGITWKLDGLVNKKIGG